MKKKQMMKMGNKGITLIALIITIIVLIILATISVAMFTGENSVMTKANKAKVEAKKAEYLEELRVIGLGLQPDRKLEEWDNQNYMNIYEEEIKKDTMFSEAKEIRQLPNKEKITIQVITKEGYVYWITEEQVEYRGTLGENIPPDLDLEKSNIEFIPLPSEWTNKDVEVEIKTEIEGYVLQYSLDAENWQDYKEPIIMQENGPIYARLVNDLGETGNYATANIQNIDRELPTVEIENNGGSYTILANEMNVSISTIITAEDTGGSGVHILQYQFATSNTMPAEDDSNWKDFINGEEIIENVEGGTYYLYTKVIDLAGNRATEIQKSEPYLVNYQIKYDANGGTGAPEAQEKIKGTDLVLNSQIPTRDHFRFVGWGTSNGATTATYQPGATLSQDRATCLYAVWEGNQYSITLNNQGATTAGTTTIYENYAKGIYADVAGTKEISTSGISVPAKAYTVTFNYNGNGTANTSAKGTYTFGGYYTGTNGSGTQMIANTGKMTASFTNTFYQANGTLYAKWTGGAVTLPTPSRTNYTFAGWYTATSGGNKIGNGGASYVPTANITLYARWTPAPKVSITANPSALTVVAGNSARFTMSASGAGTITYQWYYRTSSTGAGTAISGATSSTYTLAPSTGWNGRYLYCVATSTVAGSKATATTSSVLLTVQPAYYSTVKSGVTTYYNNLATAHAGAVSGAGATAGGTITVLANVSDSSTVSISKTITLNMNGKTITRTAPITSASTSANITLSGSGTISSSVRVFEFTSGGTISVNGQTLTSTQYAAIATAGTFRLNSGTITAKTNGIISRGTLNIAGGSISKISGSTASNQNVHVFSGSMLMSAGTITSASSYGIVVDSGTATINGGTITSTLANSQGVGIYQNGGTVNIGSSSGTLSNTNPIVTGTGYGVVKEAGNLYFYNGGLQGGYGAYKGAITGRRSGTSIRTIRSGSYMKAYLQ